jgi:hypothetical protein
VALLNTVYQSLLTDIVIPSTYTTIKVIDYSMCLLFSLFSVLSNTNYHTEPFINLMTPSIFPTPGGICTISGYNFGTSAPNVQVNVNNQGKRSELIDEPPKNVSYMYSRMYV